VHVETAAAMQQAVLERLGEATLVVMAAAVSDYRVAVPAAQKLKKQERFTLELERTSDILRQVVQLRRPGTLVVGFAAETERMLEEGRRKLHEKGVDAIVANDVSRAESGFGVDRNGGWWLTREVESVLPISSKREMAERIFDGVVQMRLGAAAAAGVLG
jgi:phosphopantothenoylcysteine decarboxylase/phosphopantothenate--cysteine ligase